MIATADNLSALCAEAKKAAAREAIDRANADRVALYALLKSETPKVRKNAARLVGALASQRDAAALSSALLAEKTLFVVPSILLALGSVGGEAADAALAAYTPPAASCAEEQTHIEAILDALHKARAKHTTAALLRYTLAAPRKLLAVAPQGFADVLQDELTALGFAPEPAPDGCYVLSENWESLYATRCMSELLIPLNEHVPLDAQAIASAAAAELTVPYRIELTDYAGDRGKLLSALVRAIGGENNPSRYALELRIVCGKKSCALYLKPSYDESRRYVWRAKTISASMKPALGACLARYIAPRVDKPRVLDPFCGSGSLLFSCEEAFACASLLGVDISASAITAARQNAIAGKSRVKFVDKDILRFVPREPVDLVISNLPFGNRVGTHEDNRLLYAAFLKKLPTLLAPGGIALLYTMEYRLLMDCIEKTKPALLLDTRRTEAGGLLPWVFVLRV